MKIKIISDGLSTNTYVINAETGERIQGVVKVDWSCEAGQTAQANIEFINVPVEVVGEVEDEPNTSIEPPEYDNLPHG